MAHAQQYFAALLAAILLFGGMLPAFAFAVEPDDDHYDEQWYLEQIDAPEAWETTTGSSSIVVAVLDTGIDLDHPDLEDNLWKNISEIDGNGVDDDGNGYVDDLYGWDFVDDDSDPTPDTGPGSTADAISHGSVIAGLIGATGDNNEGVAGVQWDVRIMTIRILDKRGAGNSVDASAGIAYAVENGADVINLSFSGEIGDAALRQAVKDAYEAGVVVVAALGNDGKNVNADPVYPACYEGDDDWVIGVAASTKADKKSTFSNYGSDCADISAPGEDIFGVDYYDPDEGFDDAYQDGWSGTSVASPLVAGAAGILLSAYPTLTPEQVRNSLKLSVDPIGDREFMVHLGAGRLNLSNALELAAAYVDEDDVEEEEGEEESEVTGEEIDLPDTGTSPVTGEEESISSVSVGDYITSPSFSTVYYITEDEERRPFMDTNSFFTYQDSFDVVKEVTDATLPEFSLGSPMLPKTGVVLVKIQSDSTVYALGENDDDAFSPLLREIGSEELAIDLYGSAWADYVIDVEATFFPRFGSGDEMDEDDDVDTSIMKTRAKLAQLAS